MTICSRRVKLVLWMTGFLLLFRKFFMLGITLLNFSNMFMQMVLVISVHGFIFIFLLEEKAVMFCLLIVMNYNILNCAYSSLSPICVLWSFLLGRIISNCIVSGYVQTKHVTHSECTLQVCAVYCSFYPAFSVEMTLLP